LSEKRLIDLTVIQDHAVAVGFFELRADAKNGGVEIQGWLFKTLAIGGMVLSVTQILRAVKKNQEMTQYTFKSKKKW
jgi:hypothetical protein